MPSFNETSATINAPLIEADSAAAPTTVPTARIGFVPPNPAECARMLAGELRQISLPRVCATLRPTEKQSGYKARAALTLGRLANRFARRTAPQSSAERSGTGGGPKETPPAIIEGR